MNRHFSGSSDSLSSNEEGEPTRAGEPRVLSRRRKIHKESLQAQEMKKNHALRNVLQHPSLRPTSSDPSMSSSSRAGVTIRVRKPSNDVRGADTLSLDGVSLARQSWEYDEGDTDGAVHPPVVNSQVQMRKRKLPILLDMHKDVKFDESPTELDKERLVDQSTGED